MPSRVVRLLVGFFLLASTAIDCTIKVEVPPPTLNVACVEVVLPGGQVSTVCPEAGADTGDAD